ncbi:alpha-amylase [Favolaschia claudopus]|uniref:Alpha-amylase n=1 Tax=Favolaschia claudopus TaxID=2862362 RepID=A0AAW0DQD7_9AGAR
MLSSLSKIALLSVLSIDCAFAAGGRVLRRAPSKSSNAIVQLFEWPWDSVALECSTLASAGYGYVQVSPAQEHIQGSQWWTDYQPVSYKLVSKRGDRSAFAKMVQACNGVGVGVIVDVVFNHMTAGSGSGFAGSTYTKYNYPTAGYTSSNFHYCNGNSASDISNYNNAYNVQNCELVGLADLAQEQPYVQQVIAAFLNDLLSLGAAGFRIDAAKHMRDADIASILALVNGTYYDTQEVIYGNGEAVNPSQYTTTGDVMEFRATTAAQACFLGRDSGGIAKLVTPTPMGSASPWGFVDSSIANYIMANQDTERSGSSLNAQSGNNVYVLSAVFMLGFNYGTPTVYSGYDYNNNYDAGAPQNSTGYTNQVTCGSNGWRCEHRIQAISSMVAFHNAANANGSAPLTNIQTGTNQQIAFGRGSIGFLIINNDNQVWSNTWTTSLPAGIYCDIIHGCAQAYNVSSDGKLSASVASRDALAIYIGAPSTTSATSAVTTTPATSPTSASAASSVARSSSSSARVVASSITSPTTSTTSTATSSSTTTTSTTPQAPVSTAATITFSPTANVGAGETLKVVGSISQLGSWAPSSALTLSQSSGNSWTLTVTLPPATSFEFKYIRVSNGGSVTWEDGSNRVYTTPNAGSSVTLYGTFGSTTSGTSAVTGASGNSPTTTPSAAPTTTTTPASVSTAVTVTFTTTANTASDESVKVVGSISQLGNWAPSAALALSRSSSNGDWTLSTTLPPNTYFEYKYIKVSSSGSVTWESGSNRIYTTPNAGSSGTLSGAFR